MATLSQQVWGVSALCPTSRKHPSRVSQLGAALRWLSARGSAPGFPPAQYYAECHGVIYVIDSTDEERLSESKQAFGGYSQPGWGCGEWEGSVCTVPIPELGWGEVGPRQDRRAPAKCVHVGSAGMWGPVWRWMKGAHCCLSARPREDGHKRGAGRCPHPGAGQ